MSLLLQIVSICDTLSISITSCEVFTMSNTKWVAGWGTACTTICMNHTEYFKDQTFRYVIYPTVDGTGLRLHFSNRFNTEPTTITRVTVAQRTEGSSIDPATLTPVTFGGSESLTMEAHGEHYVSDDIKFDFKAGKEFSVSLYCADLTLNMTGHSNNGYYIKKYYTKGDHTSSADIPWETWGENGPYCFLHTIDFETPAKANVRPIVAFGDSITAQPWPDCLARRLLSLGITDRTVVRKGIGGNRMLRDYIHRIKKHWGPAGVKRFEREVLQAGVERVFLLHGINDLIHPGVKNPFCSMSELPTTEEMIERGYKQYIKMAHDNGVKIYLATILPCPRCMNDDGVREKIRLEVNAWIRSQTMSDGVIDFEAAVWDPADHQQIFAEYDSGDHLHPSLAGAQKMADSIPEAYLR